MVAAVETLAAGALVEEAQEAAARVAGALVVAAMAAAAAVAADSRAAAVRAHGRLCNCNRWIVERKGSSKDPTPTAGDY